MQSLNTNTRGSDLGFNDTVRLKCPQRAVFIHRCQKHGARQSHRCVKPSFSRILTRTRFAPYALGKHHCPTTGTASRAFEASFLGSLVEWSALQSTGQLRQLQLNVYYCFSFLVNRLVSCGHFVGTARAFWRPCFLGGLARGSSCVQIRRMVVRG